MDVPLPITRYSAYLVSVGTLISQTTLAFSSLKSETSVLLSNLGPERYCAPDRRRPTRTAPPRASPTACSSAGRARESWAQAGAAEGLIPPSTNPAAGSPPAGSGTLCHPAPQLRPHPPPHTACLSLPFKLTFVCTFKQYRPPPVPRLVCGKGNDT